MSLLCDPGLGSSNANNAFFVFSIVNSLCVLILLYNHSACIVSSVALLIILYTEFLCYNRCQLPEPSPNSNLPLYVLSIQFTFLLQSLISIIQIYSFHGNVFEMTTIVLFLLIRIVHCVWLMGVS
jgi:hypothetical protein